jgi:cytochrome P450
MNPENLGEDEIRRLPLPPRVPGTPILGSSRELMTDPAKFIVEKYKLFGPIYRFKTPVRTYTVMVGPQANAFAHEDNRGYLVARNFWKPVVEELGSPNAVTALDGEDHKTLRKALGPIMARSIPENRLDDVFKVTREYFERHAREGELIPFVDFCGRLVSSQIGYLLTNRIPPADAHQAIFEMFKEVFITIGLGRMPRFVLKLRGRKYRDAKARAFAFADAMVAERRALPRENRDGKHFVDYILEAAEAYPRLFTEGDIRMAGLLPFYAGVDTMGQSICYGVYELFRRPEVLERVRAEVDSFFADGPPSVKDFRGMEDLAGAIMEVNRIHPTAFAMTRVAGRDFAFEGYRVKKGTEVLVGTTACHGLPEYFEHPERFDIDRYRPPRNEHLVPHVYAPFGKGPHACLGSGFANVVMMATFGVILHHFDLELEDPDRVYKKVLIPTPSLPADFRVRFKGWRNRPH